MRAAFACLVVGGLAGGGGCDCAGVAGVPPKTAECTSTVDCDLNQLCREGKCEGGLPVEGEGEVSEGEEGEGEGEGEDDNGFVIAPTTLALPAVNLGGSSTGSAQIVNTGDVALSITSVTSSNAVFAVTGPAAGTSVGRDGSVALDVRFTPTAAGAATATLSVLAGGVTRTLSVSSNAVAPIEAGALQFAAGPDDAGLGLDACQCKAPISPANVDITYQSGATTCRKPANIACGVSDACAPCSLGAQGEARWRSGRTEQPRQGDAPWIVDEEFIHQGAGADQEPAGEAVRRGGTGGGAAYGGHGLVLGLKAQGVVGARRCRSAHAGLKALVRAVRAVARHAVCSRSSGRRRGQRLHRHTGLG
jgi:hypothetical protein